jgi:pimeloyl-ACP methyl ester carboxylesterase
MTTFVIVHGAFGGGWEWTPVAKLLRESGHQVFTPTLTGMGERGHLGPDVSLSTHVQDIASLIEFEMLQGIVLCGASYGGMAITGAADLIPERIARLVYVDALIPFDGQCGLDLLPNSFRDLVSSFMDENGHGWVPVPAGILPPEGLISEDTRRDYVARLGPQPAATFTEPVRLTGAAEKLSRAFVRCTLSLDVGGDPIAPMAHRARAEGWPYRELVAPHDPQLFDPVATAKVLEELAR